MTEDRDFKNVVRKRSAKTGESYQTAKRQLEREPARLSAAVNALFAHPAGLVLGCTVERGRLTRGMAVTVMAGDTVLHQGTVAGLRIGPQNQEVVTAGDCGFLLDPPFHGDVADEVDEAAVARGGLKSVDMVPLPYRIVG